MKVRFERKDTLDANLLILQAKEKNKEIDAVIKYITKISSTLTCKHNQQYFAIPIQEFVTFYSSQKNVYACTSDQEFTVSYRLYELEVLLPENFIRISNTEIINLHEVKEFSLTGNGFILITFTNGKKSSSSRRFLKKIKEKLL